MAYDETTFRRPPTSGDEPGVYRPTGTTAADMRGRPELDDTATRLSAAPPEPPTRFGEEGRDRMGIHVGWEIVLLLAAAVICFLLYRLDPTSLKRPSLDTLLLSGTSIGLLTMGAGLSMRAGVPNLAVGPIAIAAALQFAENGDKGLVASSWPAIAIAAVGGLVIALFILVLHVPGWLASLGAALGVVTYVQLRTGPVHVQGGYDPSHQAFFLFGGFALLAVIGGALATVPPIRRLLGRMRPDGDPAWRRGFAVSLPVIGALVVSSVFAVAAGILMATQSHGSVVPDTGLQWTGIAIGTALLAGTSAFGRRGGVFGTLLAVAAMALFLDYADRRNLHIALYAIAACAIGGGLIVTRLVETYGRPLAAGVAAEDWNGAPTTGTANWRADLLDTWTPNAPAQPRPDRWDDGPWGSGR